MIEDTARALVHFEVEPNYAGWTLSDYVARLQPNDPMRAYFADILENEDWWAGRQR